jgi:DNA helicase HerA-like ATPase
LPTLSTTYIVGKNFKVKDAMNIGKEFIARAGPRALSNRAGALLNREAAKGCLPRIYPYTVGLEPAFQPIGVEREHSDVSPFPPDATPVTGSSDEQIVCLDIWISPDQSFDWKRSELFIKLLCPVRHPVMLELGGNKVEIRLAIRCHIDDAEIVQNAFISQFDKSEVCRGRNGLVPCLLEIKDKPLVFRDYYPPPPYSHLITRPDELLISPYLPVLRKLSGLPDGVTGAVQIVFQPVSPENDWHRNVQALLDLEFAAALWDGTHPTQRFAQQAPSNELRHMAADVETKAHPDKPFYAVALRVLVRGEAQGIEQHLTTLSAFTSPFVHGGRPLRYVSDAEYNQLLTREEIISMFTRGLSHRPGFLLNSWELSGLIHLPAANSIEIRQTPLKLLAPVTLSCGLATHGTAIGEAVTGNQRRSARIPKELDALHLHMLGAPGQGKTTTLEHMVLQDIDAGHGMAVIDPHGDLITRLLHLIPKEAVERTIFMDPGDPEWVPLWNPLKRAANQDIHRTADDLVYAFKRVVSGWGDRLEHLLRHTFQALMQMPEASLFDAAVLLQIKSEESKQMRQRIAAILDNPLARRFWQQDFDGYRREDLAPAQHKLSKLLVAGGVSHMLSQAESKIDFRKIMDEGHILLIDLSRIGSEARDLLGSFVLSLFHQAAIGRSVQPPNQRKFFRIYCDEAHRFVGGPIEDLLAETRKFNVGMVLAHQYLLQFESDKIGALSNAGTTVIFRVDAHDARHLTKDLQTKVKPEVLIKLNIGEAVARIGAEVVWIATPRPRNLPATNFLEEIVEHAHTNYCSQRDDIQRPHKNWAYPGTRSTNVYPALQDDWTEEEFRYDEFQ